MRGRLQSRATQYLANLCQSLQQDKSTGFETFYGNAFNYKCQDYSKQKLIADLGDFFTRWQYELQGRQSNSELAEEIRNANLATFNAVAKRDFIYSEIEDVYIKMRRVYPDHFPESCLDLDNKYALSDCFDDGIRKLIADKLDLFCNYYFRKYSRSDPSQGVCIAGGERTLYSDCVYCEVGSEKVNEWYNGGTEYNLTETRTGIKYFAANGRIEYRLMSNLNDARSAQKKCEGILSDNIGSRSSAYISSEPEFIRQCIFKINPAFSTRIELSYEEQNTLMRGGSLPAGR
jgi:hypothetical protein